ncbi:MAG: chorismate synthase [Candidatus Micrarchaeota archaeon]
MNIFGKMFRVSIYGESHGKEVGIVIDGCPSGQKISDNDFKVDLDRRKSGALGTTTRKEPDIPIIKSGIWNGMSTGSPICIAFENKDVKPKDYSSIKDTPRPGHADFVAFQKSNGFNDYRGGGHFSGRLTAPLVAAGVIAKKIIGKIKVEAKLIEVSGSDDFEKEISKAVKDEDSVGGIIECRISNVPVGLGEPFFDSIESELSHAIFSIPGIKGIEFGAGFDGTKIRGSVFNDEIIDDSGKTDTNNSGGINGGITNGNEIVFRVAVRPTASIKKPLRTIDLQSGKMKKISTEGRHDACIAVRVPVVVEATAAIVLADMIIRKNSR